MKKVRLLLVILSIIFSPAYTNASTKKADVDLAKLNAMMAYAGVFNILSAPDDYIGKTIKIKGQYDFYHDPDTGNNYFGVNIMDASACCTAGWDFVLNKNYQYPKDYPKLGAVITIIGKFETYNEGDDLFCHLADAEIVKN